MEVGSHNYGPLGLLVPPQTAERRRRLRARFEQLQEAAQPQASGGSERQSRTNRQTAGGRSESSGPPASSTSLEAGGDEASPRAAARSGGAPLSVKHEIVKESTSAKTSNRGKIFALDWLSGSSKFVVAAQNGLLVGNAATMQYEHIIPGSSYVAVAATNLQRNVVCAVTSRNEVQILDLRLPSRASSSSPSASSTPIAEIALDQSQQSAADPPPALSWSFNAMHVAVSTGGSNIHLIDWANGKTLNSSSFGRSLSSGTSRPSASSSGRMKLGATWKTKSPVRSLCFEPFGEIVFAATEAGNVEAFSPSGSASQRKERLGIYRSHLQECLSIAADPLCRYVMTGGSDQSISLFDVNAMVCVDTLFRVGGAVPSLDFNSDGLLSGFAVEAEMDGDSPVSQPAVCVATAEGLEVVWAGVAAGTPSSLKWSNNHHQMAYVYDIPSSSSPQPPPPPGQLLAPPPVSSVQSTSSSRGDYSMGSEASSSSSSRQQARSGVAIVSVLS